MACTLVDLGQFLTNPDVTELERSCDSATRSYELLLIHPDNKNMAVAIATATTARNVKSKKSAVIS